MDILKALNLRNEGIQFVSCPTCGRTKIDLIAIAGEVECRLSHREEADQGGSDGLCGQWARRGPRSGHRDCRRRRRGLLFKKGEIVRKVPEDKLVDELVKEVEAL